MVNVKPLQDGLNWLQTSVQYVKGIGPYLAKLLGKLNINNYEDFLYHIPFRYLDRGQITSIHQVEVGKNRTVSGEVVASGESLLPRRGRKIFEVILGDGKGFISAKWFHYYPKYFLNRFKKGERFLFFGEVSAYRGQKQMVHPEVEAIGDLFEEEELQKRFLGLVPVYSTTEGLSQRQIRKGIQFLLEQIEARLPEVLPAEILATHRLPPLLDSFQRIHLPIEGDVQEEWVEHRSPFHRRLIFCEFFYLQLGLGIRRRQAGTVSGFAHRPLHQLRQQLLSGLPFELTEGQKRSIGEISKDMCSPHPMNRLLQGDVGSGKTLVSLIAALLAVENGHQVALMAPTEILAEQHARNFKQLLGQMGIPTELLTSAVKGSARKAILEKIRNRTPLILIGTHALLEEEVAFENLSLVVIDEQHRFGVRQRMKLMRKAERPDVLVLTATPIPRSLAMTLYGDLDLSLMTEMPRGRQPIVTRVMQERDRPKLYEFIRKKLQEGRQAYFVFPLIEESEKLALKDASRALEKLTKIFPEFELALLHGRMRNEQKEGVMARFIKGEIKVLVATTVIEVGIDVPNATIMVVEHAERFGLSQLHQLRGRVGRGSEKSYCILAADFKKSELAQERLAVMEESNDGFRIAEEDLKIRGPGDFLGTRQSGLPDFRVANLITDLALLEEAKGAAGRILEEDPELMLPKNQILRMVLEHRWKGRLGLAEVG